MSAQPVDLSDLLIDSDIDDIDLEPPKKKRKVDQRGRHWFLTWNNPPDGSVVTLANLSCLCTHYVYQKELAPSGTPHWQGCFSFKHAKFWSELDNKLDPKGAWARCKNVMAARNYCAKLDSRIGETFSKGYVVGIDIVKDPLEGKQLYRFQKLVLQLIARLPDERTVHWFWSYKGCIGKTSLCKHLCLKHNAVIVGGRCQDAYYVIAQRKMKKIPIDVVVFNIPRSKGNEIDYEGVEGIKDGLFCSTKYESGMCCMNNPHVIVFANMAPVLGALSLDRWDIHCLDMEDDLSHL